MWHSTIDFTSSTLKTIKFILPSSYQTVFLLKKGGKRQPESFKYPIYFLTILSSTSMLNHISMCNWKVKQAVIKYWFRLSRMKPINFRCRWKVCAANPLPVRSDFVKVSPSKHCMSSKTHVCSPMRDFSIEKQKKAKFARIMLIWWQSRKKERINLKKHKAKTLKSRVGC